MRIQVGLSSKGKNTMDFLEGISKKQQPAVLNEIGIKGVSALSRATPKDTSETANSWSHKVIPTSKGFDVAWYNAAHPNTSVPVALLLQYGHGTRNGGYVPGRDYINPALRPIFESASDKILKELIN